MAQKDTRRTLRGTQYRISKEDMVEVDLTLNQQRERYAAHSRKHGMKLIVIGDRDI